jgi:hypothetical protein
MKKYLAIITLAALCGVTQSWAQTCPTLANSEPGYPDFNVEWERDGNTLYYHITVDTPTEFIGTWWIENFIGLEVSGLDFVWGFYYDEETFPYGHAEYCGSVDITGAEIYNGEFCARVEFDFVENTPNGIYLNDRRIEWCAN